MGVEELPSSSKDISFTNLNPDTKYELIVVKSLFLCLGISIRGERRTCGDSSVTAWYHERDPEKSR